MSGSSAPNGDERPVSHHNEASGTSDSVVQAQRITGGIHFHPRRHSHRPMVWIGIAVVLVLAATLVAVVWIPTMGTGEPALTVRTRQSSVCPGGNWVFPPDFDLTNLPPPESLDGGAAYRLGAATASAGSIELTVHGHSPNGAVVLQDLRVRVLSRKPAPRNALVVRTCTGAGGLSPRRFDIDLDDPQPRPVPGTADEETPGDELGETPEFPYRVSSTDPEVFWIFAETEKCACRWQLELDWASPEGSGTETIDMSGQPFRTTASEGLRRYNHLSP